MIAFLRLAWRDALAVFLAPIALFVWALLLGVMV